MPIDELKELGLKLKATRKEKGLISYHRAGPKSLAHVINGGQLCSQQLSSR